LQHGSFLGSALLFWWALLRADSPTRNHGAAFFYVFTTAIHTSVLGALLTFSSTTWYLAYATTTEAWGLSPLEDQQLGGLVMWVPGGLIFLVAGLALFAKWMRDPISQPAFLPLSREVPNEER
jgi:putative membrane protein